MNILQELLKKFPDKPWDWNGIACNPNITMNDINDNPNKPWDWRKISKNGGITWK